MKIMVLMGGPSPERDISLMSGKAISDSLRRLGHTVEEEDFSYETYLNIVNLKPDLVFNTMHGSPGEDGIIQGMLDVLNVPYTGSGVMASSLSMDKAALKQFLGGSDVDINMPDWFLVPPAATTDIAVNRLAAQGMHYPVIVKPTSAGSTIGINVVEDEKSLASSIMEARKISPRVMVEDFIVGKEITISMVGNDVPIVLPSQEIVAESGFYDYDSKYTPGKSEHVFPPTVDPAAVFKAEEMAERAYIEAGCRGYARADFMVSESDEPFFLELNTIPGMTETSLVPDAAREYGWDFDELIKRIVVYALE